MSVGPRRWPRSWDVRAGARVSTIGESVNVCVAVVIVIYGHKNVIVATELIGAFYGLFAVINFSRCY